MRILRRLADRLGVPGICTTIAVAFALLRLATPWPLELLDLKALDLRFTPLRGTRQPTNAVVIVGIDERSLARYGRWPWPRSRLAELVERLTGYGVRTIAFDAVFDQADAANDAAFAAAIRKSGRVVLGEFFDFDSPPATTVPMFRELPVHARGDGTKRLRSAKSIHGPIDALEAAAADVGHVNFLPDIDGGFRRVPLAIRLDDAVAPALSVAAVRHWLGRDTRLTMGAPGETRLVVGDKELPIDDNGELRIDFLGPPGTVPNVSALDVIEQRVSRPALDGKLVLIAPTATGFDSRPTPFSGSSPGVEIHASVIDNLLRGRGLVRPPWLVPVEAAGILVLGIVAGVLIAWRAFAGVVGALALYTIVFAASQLAFAFQGTVTTVVYPFAMIITATLAGLAYQYASAEGQRQYVRGAFERYVGSEVADLLAREPERLVLGGQKREVSIMFTDIRGFSTIAEHMQPEALAELLTEHLSEQTRIVFAHEGFLDKYIGDAVMAFWGAPLDVPDHARRACAAALDIAAAMPKLRAEWAARGWPEVHLGVGVATGEAIVGNFGSALRFSYTAISDDVNLASRLEGLNKVYGTQILVSEQTHREIGNEFVCREIDCVRVKGKRKPVVVYELLCRRTEDAGGRAAHIAGAFTQAFVAYRRRRFGDAIAALEAVRTNHDGADPALDGFVARCRALVADPPGESWDGVYDALTK